MPMTRAVWDHVKVDGGVDPAAKVRTDGTASPKVDSGTVFTHAYVRPRYRRNIPHPTNAVRRCSFPGLTDTLTQRREDGKDVINLTYAEVGGPVSVLGGRRGAASGAEPAEHGAGELRRTFCVHKMAGRDGHQVTARDAVGDRGQLVLRDMAF